MSGKLLKQALFPVRPAGSDMLQQRRSWGNVLAHVRRLLHRSADWMREHARVMIQRLLDVERGAWPCADQVIS